MSVTVLVTGFGPFPGAPFNPSAVLVGELARRRRPAFADVVRTTHVFATSYAAVDRDLPKLFAEKPDLVLIFGVAGRRRYLSVETRARNALSVLYPDVSGHRPARGTIERGKPGALRGAAPFAQLLCAVRPSGFPARLSRDADVICATMLFGARWRKPARRRRSFNSSTFPISNCRVDTGRAAKRWLFRRYWRPPKCCLSR